MKKDIEVIEYLLGELKEALEYKEGFEVRLQEAKDYATEKGTRLSYDIIEKFKLEERPDNALIAQNSKKIRKILLKLY